MRIVKKIDVKQTVQNMKKKKKKYEWKRTPRDSCALYVLQNNVAKCFMKMCPKVKVRDKRLSPGRSAGNSSNTPPRFTISFCYFAIMFERIY